MEKNCLVHTIGSVVLKSTFFFLIRGQHAHIHFQVQVYDFSHIIHESACGNQIIKVPVLIDLPWPRGPFGSLVPAGDVVDTVLVGEERPTGRMDDTEGDKGDGDGAAAAEVGVYVGNMAVLLLLVGVAGKKVREVFLVWLPCALSPGVALLGVWRRVLS